MIESQDDTPRDEETPEAPEQPEEPTTAPDLPRAGDEQRVTGAGGDDQQPVTEAGSTGDDQQPDTGVGSTPDESAAGEEAPAPEEAAAAAEAPAPSSQPPAPETSEERPRPPRREKADKRDEPELIPGAHLEPDLVLDQPSAEEADEYAHYAEGDTYEEEAEAAEPEPVPAARTPLDLAADARYQATGKRKTAVARVILKPGSGVYTINKKTLDEYFPRPRLQRQARGPLEATGNDSRMDVVARIHGGGVAAQAGALRHGIARALVEAEPALRVELKRRGFLTRDPREKERRKAGLKKARKRPQFSKR